LRIWLSTADAIGLRPFEIALRAPQKKPRTPPRPLAYDLFLSFL
jgi:hypothetical protein